METVLFVCLMIVPIISIFSLVLSIENMRRQKIQKKLLQQLLAKQIGNNDEVTNFILEGV